MRVRACACACERVRVCVSVGGAVVMEARRVVASSSSSPPPSLGCKGRWLEYRFKRRRMVPRVQLCALCIVCTSFSLVLLVGVAGWVYISYKLGSF